jgi:hypothetical protein
LPPPTRGIEPSIPSLRSLLPTFARTTVGQPSDG